MAESWWIRGGQGYRVEFSRRQHTRADIGRSNAAEVGARRQRPKDAPNAGAARRGVLGRVYVDAALIVLLPSSLSLFSPLSVPLSPSLSQSISSVSPQLLSFHCDATRSAYHAPLML